MDGKNQDYLIKVKEDQKDTWTSEQFWQWRKNHATEEALAEMAWRGEKVTDVKKLVYAIQKVLRAIGLGDLADMRESKTDASALMALHKTKLFVRSGKDDNVDLKRVMDAIREQSGIVSIWRKKRISVNRKRVGEFSKVFVVSVQVAWQSARTNGDTNYADYFGFYVKRVDHGIAPGWMTEIICRADSRILVGDSG